MPESQESKGRSDFEGKVALVVGASKGIGAETAKAFARRGAEVVLSSRDEAGLRGIADAIRKEGGRARVHVVDLLVVPSIDALGSFLRSEVGRLDFAFNNAGEGYVPTPLADVPPEAFERVLRLTVEGTFRVMREEIPLMLKSGGGAVVNMSSTAGVSAYVGGSPYVAAKHAVIGLTKAAAIDYAARGVRVNAVAPGPIDTHRLQGLPESYRAQARQAVPMRRLGSPSEVADAVVWLCSRAAGFLTGTTIFVDGGRMAGWA
jgi:NAD(P)-dependent dehydrogenase (short-subunit alcohol dehydrogenase family)